MIERKVFFLNTSPFFQNEIGTELIHQEFEIYYTNEYANLTRILKKYPESIVFVNLDSLLPEKEWETWIRRILADPSTATIKFGVLADIYNEQVEKKYTETLKVPCGYTVVSKADPHKTLKQLSAWLVAMEARGRRKYIRATSENDTQMTINIPHDGFYLKGVIKDISSVGISCVFQKDPELEKNALCKDMQIKLQTTILKTEGIVFGSRRDGLQKIYVFLFTQRVDPDARAKIRNFVQQVLQEKMNKLFG
ncbi:MAG: PilZ domain-containing protein [Treponema sp.]|nr:PilZ domain-containing protein [Treponema sp.]